MLIFSKLCWPCLISISLFFSFLFCSSPSYIIHLETNVSVFKFVRRALPGCLHSHIKRPPPRFPLAAYTNKHTPCLQMETNIDEIKLGREYLISELHVWIKLGLFIGDSQWRMRACD